MKLYTRDPQFLKEKSVKIKQFVTVFCRNGKIYKPQYYIGKRSLFEHNYRFPSGALVPDFMSFYHISLTDTFEYIISTVVWSIDVHSSMPNMSFEQSKWCGFINSVWILTIYNVSMMCFLNIKQIPEVVSSLIECKELPAPFHRERTSIFI